jgi:ethanolamine ammonia-lyase large subunit
MSNLDLVYAANKLRVTATCNTTIGCRGTLATRLQPNHATDDLEGITASLFEGLSYGSGDALIGLNPSGDTVSRLTEVLKRFDEIKHRFEIPTQICVLGHITTQIEAVRNGAPADMIFQSIAGSQKGNTAFGFTTDTVREALALLREKGTARGENVLYFETGQGSELSSDAHYGADQVTMEARCYAFAREFKPFMVNTVVGFIGPEYLYDSRQVIRAGLEDHFMGKLSGIPMGCDCCYTNHMLADQNDVENLSLLLAGAGVNYILGVPSGDDIMLNYQTNAYHDAAAIREILNLRPIREYEQWLEKMGIMENGRLTERAGDPTIFTRKR